MRFLAAFLALSCASAPPDDPRHARIVIAAPRLEQAAERAVSWWAEATGGEVAFSLVPACEPDAICDTLDVGNTPRGIGGVTTYASGHPESQTTTVSERLDPKLLELCIAHELGHVLELGHSDGIMEAHLEAASWKLPGGWQ